MKREPVIRTGRRLVHNALLSIAISVLHRVQAVHKTRLLRASGAVTVGRAGTGGVTIAVAAAGGGTIAVAAASGVDAGIKLVLESAGGATGGSSGIMVTVVTAVASGPGQASGAHSARRSESTANCSWLTLKTVVTLLTAGQAPALLLEVGHAHSGKSGRCVVLSLVVVDFVDRDGGVDDRWLDSLLLDDWLDSLEDACQQP